MYLSPFIVGGDIGPHKSVLPFLGELLLLVLFLYFADLLALILCKFRIYLMEYLIVDLESFVVK